MAVSSTVQTCSLQGRTGPAIILYAIVLTIVMQLQATRELSTYSEPEVKPSVGSMLQSRTPPAVGWNPLDPLAIPKGKAQNLPSTRVPDGKVDRKRMRTPYGGAGDKKHLGGFTAYDGLGVSPTVWKHMIEKYGVHSLLDVGCGRGISTTWFLKHDVDILCVEGSHDAVEKTLLPDPETQVVEHDFLRGPWWPQKTYDAVWAVEFLEHVSLPFQFNYVTAFRKAALIFVTSSRKGGWHHVEVHEDSWWIRKFEAYGFHFSRELTDEVRALAGSENRRRIPSPDGWTYKAFHVQYTMKVFINPLVAALPQHAHLFPEHGCEFGRKNGTIIHRECGTGGHFAEFDTPLEKSFYPIELTPEMDKEWEDMMRGILNTTHSPNATAEKR